MWRRRRQTFRRRGGRETLRVLAEELAGAVLPRNNGPREPGRVRGQGGAVGPRREVPFRAGGEDTVRAPARGFVRDSSRGPMSGRTGRCHRGQTSWRRERGNVGLGPALLPCFPPRSLPQHGIRQQNQVYSTISDSEKSSW